MNSVVITGLGAICALGNDVAEITRSIKSGISGISPIESIPSELLKYPFGAEARDFDGGCCLDTAEINALDRFSQLAVCAADQAIKDSGLIIDEHNAHSIGVIVGSGGGGKITDDESYKRFYAEGQKRVHPSTILKAMVSAAPSWISIRNGLKGPSYSVS
ncbi:MAG: beta-ketoacyl-[acyl-carrier-protein] synthase II, partial [Taibaiella sp.]|nr:beta-ketoacyl-[acyl-carrier-protein] synthase II [Taibaiella sp.]